MACLKVDSGHIVAGKGKHDPPTIFSLDFDYISSATASGIARLGLEQDIPVSFGVITVDNLDQAIERSGSKAGNKGVEAALATIEMMSLFDKIDAGES